MHNRWELRKFVAPEFLFGVGAIDMSGQYAKNLGAQKVLLVTDPGGGSSRLGATGDRQPEPSFDSLCDFFRGHRESQNAGSASRVTSLCDRRL